MRRTTLISRSVSALAVAALLAGSGCVVHLGGWTDNADVFGHSVSSHDDGSLTVDGTRLPYDRWVDATFELGGVDALELATATDVLRISGAAGTTAALKVRIHSEIEGDGTAVIEEGRLVARSQADGKVFINAIEGTVPAGLELQLTSGTGAIEASALAGTAPLVVKNGTGDVTLRGCSTGALSADVGTGALLVEDGAAPALEVESGTGAVRVVRMNSPSVHVESGTGDVSFASMSSALVQVNTGTGGITVKGCELARLEVSSGTGDLLLDGGQLERVEFESGTGNISQRNGVTIGSLTGK